MIKSSYSERPPLSLATLIQIFMSFFKITKLNQQNCAKSVIYILKLFSILVKEHYQILRFKFLRKGWTFYQFRDPWMTQSFEKILKSLLGECIVNGTFKMNLQKIFLINLHFVLNLVGNLLLVILIWSCF